MLCVKVLNFLLLLKPLFIWMYVKFNYRSPFEDNVFVYKVSNLLCGMICFLNTRNVKISHVLYNFINVLTVD
jgi:hypothetical protein